MKFEKENELIPFSKEICDLWPYQIHICESWLVNSINTISKKRCSYFNSDAYYRLTFINMYTNKNLLLFIFF